MFGMLKSLAVIGTLGAAALMAQPAKADSWSVGIGVGYGGYGGGYGSYSSGGYYGHGGGPGYYRPYYRPYYPYVPPPWVSGPYY